MNCGVEISSDFANVSVFIFETRDEGWQIVRHAFASSIH